MEKTNLEGGIRSPENYPQDKYKNFEELARNEMEGVDFDIELIDRNSPLAVIAIHGGNIEPGTTDIARALAGDDFSFYSFIGKKSENNSDLHITSSNFDETRCLALVPRSEKVISIHGKRDEEEFVMIGGLDDETAKRISDSLASGGFEIRPATENVKGNSPENICNRCSSKKGIQLEISRDLRDKFLNDKDELSKFCELVKTAIV